MRKRCETQNLDFAPLAPIHRLFRNFDEAVALLIALAKQVLSQLS